MRTKVTYQDVNGLDLDVRDNRVYGYLLFDIGCIECGEDSSVVGIYSSREKAEEARESYLDGGSSWGRTGWIGQHSVEVFEVELPITVRA